MCKAGWMTPMLRLIAAAAGLIPLAAAALSAETPAAPAERIAVRIEIYGLAGLHVATANSVVELSGDRYAVSSNLATRGVAGLFVEVSGRSEVRGRLTAAGAQPESYRSNTVRNGVARDSRLDYSADGAVSGGTNPPIDAAQHMLPMPPPEQLRGTVDNLTAYLIIQRQLVKTGSCNATIPVYDGHERYNLKLTDRGQQTLSPSGGQNLSGPAKVCRMQREDIGGFAADPAKREGARAGTIWYSRLVPAELMLPVRMELESELGDVTAYLAEVKSGRVHLALME